RLSTIVPSDFTASKKLNYGVFFIVITYFLTVVSRSTVLYYVSLFNRCFMEKKNQDLNFCKVERSMLI
ncbi:hypothetical protein KSS87_007606, partial [Heliosperma pusillum]